MPQHDDPKADRYTLDEWRAWSLLGAPTIEIAGLRLFLVPERDPEAANARSFIDDVARYYRLPQIDYALEGEELGWAGGPVVAGGWYIDPYCNPACCRPEGPFPSWPEALLHVRREFPNKTREWGG